MLGGNSIGSTAMPNAAQRSESARTTKRLAPGAPGTKRLLARFGADLVCVRYRVDQATGRRITTVELVVEEKAPKAPVMHWIRIAYNETTLRNQVKAAGGQWDATRKLWRLSSKAIKALELEKRIARDIQ